MPGFVFPLRRALLAGLFIAGGARAQPVVTVRLEAGRAGPALAEDFAGLSFETQQVLRGEDGEHFFRPSNRALIDMMRALGVRSVRIGGNTTDNPAVPVPGPADLDSLFAFARAADVRIIYTLRLRRGSPSGAGAVARYIAARYADRLTCFAIGNEPDVYDPTYPAYLADLKAHIAAITAPDVAPDAVFCAPSTTPSKADWARRLARDLGTGGRIRFISQHDYPGANGRLAGAPELARDRMLSRAWVKAYDDVFASFAPAAAAAHLPFRLEEANNYYNGGARGASDTLAAALWGLDYLHWWGAHGAAGVNFHTGDWVAAADDRTPCLYAVFRTAGAHYDIRPLGYALKLYALTGGGRPAPAVVTANPGDVNLTAYATLSPDGGRSVTLINKEHGAGGRLAQVRLEGVPVSAAAVWLDLSAPEGAAATAGLRLGGAPLGPDGAWMGAWRSLPERGQGEDRTVEVPPATALVLKIAG